jgi:F-type H+-transporting ATPase subunit c
MRNKKMLLLMALFLLVACPMFGQTPGGSSGVGPGELKFLGAMVGLGLAAGLCGTGQGKAVGSAVEAIARNPGAEGGIRGAMILGLAFIESLTIFTMLIVFIKYGNG